MPQLRPGFLLLASLSASACAVSFDGYELAPSDASSGTGGGSVGGGTGGISAGGGSGGSVGGSAGTPNGGTGGDGGTGGVPVGGGGAAGSGGGTGGTTGGGTGGGTGGTPACPSEGGPMQAVPKTTGGSYCVDNTEVTQKKYNDFLGANPGSLPQIPECSGQSFTPSGTCNGWNPVQYPQRPAVCVDWCDAVGFCNYVGKHLCGTIGGGGPVAPSSANNAALDEWYNACSAGGTLNYPYGNLYDSSKCNTLEDGPAHSVDVMSFAGCEGGYPDLHDMSGNVREWTNSCSGSNCMQRGGGWLETTTSNPYKPDCKSNGMGPKIDTSNQLGFRCCSDTD